MLPKTIAMTVGCLLAILFSQGVKADEWASQDKVNHFAMSAAMSSLTAKTHGGVLGMSLALVPGIAKELSDLYGAGTPSTKDMVANIVGVVVGAYLPEQYMIAPIAPRGAIEGVSITYMLEL